MFNPTLLSQRPWRKERRTFLSMGAGTRRSPAKMLRVWDVSEQELICAAREGRVSDVEKILRRHQNPNVTDEEGETPLGHAVCAGHLEVVRLLLKARASTERPGAICPCLHAASEIGHLDIVRLLVEKKSDKNAQDEVGSTALTRAATAGQFEVVRFLVMVRADVDKVDRLNGTALKYASARGDVRIVRLLLQKKADFGTVDWLGMTAVRWAACRGHEETKQLLMEAGADESGYIPTRFVTCIVVVFLLCMYGLSLLLRRCFVSIFYPSMPDFVLGDMCQG